MLILTYPDSCLNVGSSAAQLWTALILGHQHAKETQTTSRTVNHVGRGESNTHMKHEI